jgi:hypothetical protein
MTLNRKTPREAVRGVWFLRDRRWHHKRMHQLALPSSRGFHHRMRSRSPPLIRAFDTSLQSHMYREKDMAFVCAKVNDRECRAFSEWSIGPVPKPH